MATSTPRSMVEVAELMRRSLPAGISLSQFGTRMRWGRGNDDARQRIATLTREELEAIGLTKQQAEDWAVAYEAVEKLMPENPSAAGRVELMRHAVKLFVSIG